MQCIYCEGQTQVKNTVKLKDRVLRERICKECNKRQYSEERVPGDAVDQYVIKRLLSVEKEKRRKG